MSDITAVKRDGALGDGFSYDLTQQIIGYAQNGTVNLANGTVTSPQTNTNLAFDGCGNKTSMNNTPYLPPNNMNQPTDPGITYDTNGNLKTWNSDMGPEQAKTTKQVMSLFLSSQPDALGQQITRYAQNGTVDLAAGTIASPGTDTNLAFDGCGNMRSKNDAPYLPPNNMNQPTDPGVTYDTNGNLKTYNGYVYNYDAQNRLRSVVNVNNVAVAQFWYDGLNRQVARSTTVVTIPNLPVTTSTFSVWDGDWAILEEYTTGNVLTQSYVQGAHGLVKTLPNNIYYYQDSLGSTSHVASSTGSLLEYYKYDLYGKPTVWSPANSQLPSSNFGIQDLHGGQRWMPQLGLYDDRNRFMSPDLGRFLQPDPIGFKGDNSNLYRYCGNDWANRTDPMGLQAGPSMYTTEANIASMDKMPVDVTYTFARREMTGSHIPRSVLVSVTAKVVERGAQSAAQANSGGQDFSHTPGSVQARFYDKLGNLFNSVFRQVLGDDAQKVARQTTANAPELDVSYSAKKLGLKARKSNPNLEFQLPDGKARGWNEPDQGRYGTIFIARKHFYQGSDASVFGTYAHELANVVAGRVLRNEYSHGDPPPPGIYKQYWDRDIGAAVQRRMFPGSEQGY